MKFRQNMNNSNIRRFLSFCTSFLVSLLLITALVEKSGTPITNEDQFNIIGKSFPTDEKEINTESLKVVAYITTDTPTKGVILYYSDGSTVTIKRTSLKDYCKHNKYVLIEQGLAVNRDFSCLQELPDMGYIVFTIDNNRFKVHPNFATNIHHAIRNYCEEL